MMRVGGHHDGPTTRHRHLPLHRHRGQHRALGAGSGGDEALERHLALLDAAIELDTLVSISACETSDGVERMLPGSTSIWSVDPRGARRASCPSPYRGLSRGRGWKSN